MKNNLVKNNLLSYCAGAPCLPSWPSHLPLRKPESICTVKSAWPREDKSASCMTPPDSLSGAIPHAAGPFTPIPPQACPSTSSGASTAAATFPPGIPGRIITAPSGLRASAADAAPRIRSMEWRTRLPVRIAVPTAPGPLTADFRPISAADDSIYFLILFCTFETKKLIVNQKKMFDNFSFSLIVFG